MKWLDQRKWKKEGWKWKHEISSYAKTKTFNALYELADEVMISSTMYFAISNHIDDYRLRYPVKLTTEDFVSFAITEKTRRRKN